MRSGVRHALITTAALVAAVVVFAVATLPRARQTTSGEPAGDLIARTIAGAMHVHSRVSDGAEDRPEIARAAARAGLRFVVFTDHGDATRQPDPPAYIERVLCIDAVEISTNQGHYIALGMGAAPYRLGGEASAVAEDVRRLGGFGIVAHPDSSKAELSWRDWTVEPDGLEWINADSEWRNESTIGLARTMLGYLWRPGPALAAMLDRPQVTLDRWDRIAARRRVAAFAGHDAHGGGGAGVEARRRFGVPGMPSYEASFRSFSTRVVLPGPLTDEAAPDARMVVDALESGRSFTAIDANAAPAWLEFAGERAGAVAVMGEPAKGDGPTTVRARVPGTDGLSLVLLRNGVAVHSQSGSSLSTTVTEAGEYRVEARLTGRANAAPWILSNPIYVDLPTPDVTTPVAPASTEVLPLLGGEWRTEHDPASAANLEKGGGAAAMSYHLAADRIASQFAALVVPVPAGAPPFDALLVDLASSRQARVSIQLRSVDGVARWYRSAYVPPEGRSLALPVSSLLPVERGTPDFDPRRVGSILLVVDLVNATPGTAGRLVVRNIALARSN